MASEKKPESTAKENVKKWGATLMADGFTVIPNVIVMHQRKIGLQPLDFAIVAVFAKHWWRAGEPAYPGVKSIAEALGINRRTVQRRLKALVKAKLLRRIDRTKSDGGDNSAAYDLGGLIERAEPYAKKNLEEKKTKQKTKLEKRKVGLRPRSERAAS
ncbi:MAG TPA: helix-turn-helix domain-containing protein [Polyangiaceae bacterium]